MHSCAKWGLQGYQAAKKESSFLVGSRGLLPGMGRRMNAFELFNADAGVDLSRG